MFFLSFRDGSRFYIRIRGVPAFGDDGWFRGYRGSGTDVTRERMLAEKLREQANTDLLTGVANRRAFFELGEAEIERVRRYDRSLCLLMMDIDHFKHINDAHGHDAGDAALVGFVSVCRRLLRKSDTLGRLGGEEFAVLLSETDLDGARETAERVRAAIAGEAIEAGGRRVSFTVSVGSANGGDHLEDMIRRADRALYAAKEAGRDTERVAQ